MGLFDIEPIVNTEKEGKALNDKECFTEFTKAGKELDADKLLE